jgi:hypothetical protein
MKSLGLIRLATYALILAAAFVFYFLRRPSTTIPVSPAIDDERYFFGYEVGDGPPLNPAVLKKAEEIEEVVLHTELPQTGIEPLNLRLQKGGHMLRRMTSLSDYRMHRTETPPKPVLKTVETAESKTDDFGRIAYLIAELPYRPVPEGKGFFLSDWIEVLYRDGSTRAFFFESPPPEFWAITKSLHQVAADVKWKILEQTTQPDDGSQPTAPAATPSPSASAKATSDKGQETHKP